MEERKVKGKPVIYVSVGETFTAENGRRYKAVLDFMGGVLPCYYCAFGYLEGVCARYRCVASDRKDGKGVHFVECKEEN